MTYSSGMMTMTPGQRLALSRFQYVDSRPAKIYGIFNSPDWKVEKAIVRNQFQTQEFLTVTQRIKYFQMPDFQPSSFGGAAEINTHTEDDGFVKDGFFRDGVGLEVNLSAAAIRILELTGNQHILQQLGLLDDQSEEVASTEYKSRSDHCLQSERGHFKSSLKFI